MPEKYFEATLSAIDRIATSDEVRRVWIEMAEDIARDNGVPEERIKEIKKRVEEILNQEK